MFDFSAQIFNIMYLCYSVIKSILVFSLTVLTKLAISSFTHLIVAIMRHGTYYETPYLKNNYNPFHF